MSTSAGERVSQDAHRPSRARYTLAFGIWLVGAVAAIASYGMPDDLDPVGLVFVALWATFHFIVISLAVLELDVGPLVAAIATLVAVAALLVVPRAVDASIRDDPSSTAALIHIYDPLLMAVPVGAVLAVNWLVRRRRRPTPSDHASARAVP